MGSMVGVDEENMELVVEIIDFRNQPVQHINANGACSWKKPTHLVI
jgi:hypothetical protein